MKANSRAHGLCVRVFASNVFGRQHNARARARALPKFTDARSVGYTNMRAYARAHSDARGKEGRRLKNTRPHEKRDCDQIGERDRLRVQISRRSRKCGGRKLFASHAARKPTCVANLRARARDRCGGKSPRALGAKPKLPLRKTRARVFIFCLLSRQRRAFGTR